MAQLRSQLVLVAVEVAALSRAGLGFTGPLRLREVRIDVCVWASAMRAAGVRVWSCTNLPAGVAAAMPIYRDHAERDLCVDRAAERPCCPTVSTILRR